MVPSTGVHEPQREPWLVTQRTLFGFGVPPRYCRDNSAARRPSSASPRDARRALRCSCVASRSSMIAIHRCSSARDIRAGNSTMVRSPSRYADTVRRRRALRRTSTEPSDEPSEAATRAPYRRRPTPARHHAQAASSDPFRPNSFRPQWGSSYAQVTRGARSRRRPACTYLSPPYPQEHSRASPPRPQPCPQAIICSADAALTAPTAAS